MKLSPSTVIYSRWSYFTSLLEYGVQHIFNTTYVTLTMHGHYNYDIGF